MSCSLQVTLIARSHLRTKHFDASLPWVGRYKNIQFADFHSDNDWSRRLRMVREARQGGSITPRVMEALRKACDGGRLRCLEQCEVERCVWEGRGRGWKVQMRSGLCARDGIRSTYHATDERLDVTDHRIDVIWLATGCAVDVQREQLFAGVQERFPVDVVGGFPALTKGKLNSTGGVHVSRLTLIIGHIAPHSNTDLQWHRNSPGFYVMGGYATLQLGPNALNLVGARSAARLIGESILQLMSSSSSSAGSLDGRLERDAADDDDERALVLGKTTNYFELLSLDD